MNTTIEEISTTTLRNALPCVKTALPGPKAAELLRRRSEAVADSIKTIYPCVISHGEGAMLEDVDGNRFLDWVGGVGVLNVGYSNPEIIEAVKEQSEKYFHAMMNIVTHEGYVRLAEKLNSIVPVRGKSKRTMLANSGAEAVENAVKIARASTGRPNIIVFSGAFHGRTLLASTMTAKKQYNFGTGPFPDGVYRADFPYIYRRPKGMDEKDAINFYISRLEKVFDEASPAEQVAAVVLEPVQGEGGFVPAPFEWVMAVRKICDKHGILMIADEVQTGFGRSGRLFVSNYWAEQGFPPDIIACAKSIAAGIPLSAVVCGEEIMKKVRPGVLGGTFGGNALACAAALKVIEIIERDRLCERALEISKKCVSAFKEWQKEIPQIGDIRGIGSMLGLELVEDGDGKKPNSKLVGDVIQSCAKKGLIIESAGGYSNVLRFLCPLVVTDEQLSAGLAILKEAIIESA